MAAFEPKNNDAPVLETTEGDVEVRMTVKISGTRDGKDWPNKGEGLTVPAEEAAQLVANRQAVPAVETATANTADVETATPRGHKALSKSDLDGDNAPAKAADKAADKAPAKADKPAAKSVLTKD